MSAYAPQEPTVVHTNPIHDKYVVQFAPELTNFIRNGQKLKTYRFGNKYEYLKVGDEVELREYGTNNLISKAEITDKTHTTFRDLPLDWVDMRFTTRKITRGMCSQVTTNISEGR